MWLEPSDIGRALALVAVGLALLAAALQFAAWVAP
jgi:hypothetical protein